MPKSSPPYLSAGGGSSEAPPNWHLSTLPQPAAFRPQCIASQDFSRLCSQQLRCGDEVNIETRLPASLLKQTYTDPTYMTVYATKNKTHLTVTDLRELVFNFFVCLFVCIFGKQIHICNASLTCLLLFFVSFCSASDTFYFRIAASIGITFVFHHPQRLKYTKARLIYGISFFPECSMRSPRVL